MDIDLYRQYQKEDKALLLVPLGCVPNGSVVIKRAGSYEHHVTRSVVVYNNGEKQEIKAQVGCAFLAPVNRPGASFNVYSGDTLALWVADKHELADYLHGVEDK